MTSSQTLNPSIIESWHAHIYFDDTTRDAAWALRAHIATALAARVEIGRFHEQPVGPHPLWSYQLAFKPAEFAGVVSWLVLNHGLLDVFVHPNTDDALRDHRDGAMWIGRAHALNLERLAG